MSAVKKILVADALAPEGVQFLNDQPGYAVEVATGLDEAALAARIGDCQGLLVRSATQVTASLLEAAAQLRVVGRAGIGVDNIDVAAATERGILVLNTPDANATTTAELAVAHILSLSRHLPHADRSVRAGEWSRSRFVGSELAAKTVGVVGFGTIGRIVADRCRALHMHVLVHDPFVTEEVFQECGVTSASLQELLKNADYVTLHCPLSDATRGLIGAAEIRAMKRGARLINCARGGLVDEEALYTALVDGHLGGAALDVYASEPPKDSPLLALDNVVLTPHLGASTAEAQVAVGVAIARQMVAYLDCGEIVNAVNLPPVTSEALRKLGPYQNLAWRLGRVLTLMLPEPLKEVRVAINGAAAELATHPIAMEALVGLLDSRLSSPVNRINAGHLAKRQGIALTETRSEESHDYVSTVSVTGVSADQQVTLRGTVFEERHPRLVSINRYEFECPLEGHLLITQHQDRPGVVGALGELLGKAEVNISRMQVGISPESDKAIAILSLSQGLSDSLLEKVRAIPAVHKAIELAI